MEPEPIGEVLARVSHVSQDAKGRPTGGKSSSKSSKTVSCRSDLPPCVRLAPSHLSAAEWSGINPVVEKRLREAVRAWCWPIVLSGPTGTGKSCAAACLYQRWPKAAYWYRLEAFVRDVQKCRTSKDGKVACLLADGETIYRSEAGLWSLADNEHSLWCLDDFGTRSMSDAAFDVVFELLERRTGKPLIVSTNLNNSAIRELYDDRIADRMASGVEIEIVGESRRQGKLFKVTPKGTK